MISQAPQKQPDLRLGRDDDPGRIAGLDREREPTHEAELAEDGDELRRSMHDPEMRLEWSPLEFLHLEHVGKAADLLRPNARLGGVEPEFGQTLPPIDVEPAEHIDAELRVLARETRDPRGVGKRDAKPANVDEFLGRSHTG